MKHQFKVGDRIIHTNDEGLQFAGTVTVVENDGGLHIDFDDGDEGWERDSSCVAEAAAALGRIGGKAKSEKKSATSRRNGQRGGRPLSRFRLDYYGGAMSRENKAIRYRRFHETLEAARAEHVRIRDRLASSSSGIIYGPGLPQIGIPA